MTPFWCKSTRALVDIKKIIIFEDSLYRQLIIFAQHFAMPFQNRQVPVCENAIEIPTAK